jgi:hypothetical protein
LNLRKYLAYHARWQLSTLVMIGPITLLGNMNISRPVSLILVQIFGAMIFWYVDKWIFEDKEND